MASFARGFSPTPGVPRPDTAAPASGTPLARPRHPRPALTARMHPERHRAVRLHQVWPLEAVLVLEAPMRRSRRALRDLRTGERRAAEGDQDHQQGQRRRHLGQPAARCTGTAGRPLIGRARGRARAGRGERQGRREGGNRAGPRAGRGRREGGERGRGAGRATGHGRSVSPMVIAIAIPIPPGEFPTPPGSEGLSAVSWCTGPPHSCGLSNSCEPLTVHRMSEREIISSFLSILLS